MPGNPVPGAPSPGNTRGPLFDQQGMKLGIFGINVSAAGGLTKDPSRHEIDWDGNVRPVQQAERAGFEAAIPFARWRGFEGETNPWGRSFETYTWAAGIAAHTTRICVFATSHVLTVSPVFAAKQLATVDAIAGGRAGLNVVAGWFERELAMFGVNHLEHDERYEYLEEWMDIVGALWREDGDVKYSGKWLSLDGGYLQPKPVQRPRPPVMNAANSPRGHEFAARCADIAFVSAATTDAAAPQAREVRNRAEAYGRELQVWMSAAVVCADTDREAGALVRRYQDLADEQAVRNSMDWTMGGAMQMAPALRAHLAKSMASTPAMPLVGSASRVAEQIAALADAGIDGLALVWMNFSEGLDRFERDVMPLLKRHGVRQ